MRIVLDTNILVSGILTDGTPPAELLDLWWAGEFELVTSRAQFEELAGVLPRSKIARRLAPGEAERLLAALEKEAIWAEKLPPADLSPDPDDNYILATGIGGKADLIVSGDRRHMLALGEVHGIRIITAREALERVKGELGN